MTRDLRRSFIVVMLPFFDFFKLIWWTGVPILETFAGFLSEPCFCEALSSPTCCCTKLALKCMIYWFFEDFLR